MKAAYVKSPFQFEIRDVPVRAPDEDDVLIQVKACGICGTDLHTAATQASRWQPFGHEVSGTVIDKGEGVTHVETGDRVILESGTFDRFSEQARNGRVDLNNQGPNFWMKGPMGFSEFMTVPKETAVPAGSLSFVEGALIEPLGVALDLVYTAGIELNDDVLLIGPGPIGLMALQLAKAAGARNVFVAGRSHSKKRLELAAAYGCEDIIDTGRMELRDYPYPRVGVEKVLVTAPPVMIPPSLEVLLNGGICAYIGIAFGEKARITFDADDFHFRKLQLRASFASPALYFPRCIDLVRSGAVQVRELVTRKFRLHEIGDAMTDLKNNKKETVKSIMVADFEEN